MAIDPKELDDVRPATSVVDRLKARKNRIKPWQIPTISSTAEAPPKASVAINKPQKRKSPSPDFQMTLKKDVAKLKMELPLRKASQEKTFAKNLDNNSITTREQLDNDLSNNSITTREQLDNDKTIGKPSKKDNSVTIRVTEPLTSREQLDNDLDNNSITKRSVFELTGLQKKLVALVFNECVKIGSLISPNLTNEYIRSSLNASIGTIKTTLVRVIEKGFLIRRPGKYCRGGWVVLEIPFDVYQDLIKRPLDNNSITSRKQLDNDLDNDLDNNSITTRVTEPSSSSRDLLIKEPTTTQPAAALSQIDLGLVQPFGITTSVLARCVELYPVLKPEQLEVLVFRFAEFMKDPKNKVQNARGFFISLAKQASEGQIPLDHIETPDERLMRLFVSRQEEAKTRRINFEQRAQEFECEAWLESLTPEMKLTLVPETALLKAGSAAHAAMLKSYFAENVWPARRTEILQTESAQ